MVCTYAVPFQLLLSTRTETHRTAARGASVVVVARVVVVMRVVVARVVVVVRVVVTRGVVVVRVVVGRVVVVRVVVTRGVVARVVVTRVVTVSRAVGWDVVVGYTVDTIPGELCGGGMERVLAGGSVGVIGSTAVPIGSPSVASVIVDAICGGGAVSAACTVSSASCVVSAGESSVAGAAVVVGVVAASESG